MRIDLSCPSFRRWRAVRMCTAGMLAVLTTGSALAADMVTAPGDGATGNPGGLFEQQRLTGDWDGLRKPLEAAGITLALSEQSEIWGNLRGGLKTGLTVNGLATPSLTLDLDKILHWKGATFFVNAYQIHGTGPSTALAGNQQLLSNIEATPATKLYQIWIEQTLFGERVKIRAGQEGANDEMMVSSSAQLFLNSSFGYPDPLSQNLPSGGPNYPIAAPMIRTKISVTDRITFVNAIFDGDPAGPGPGDPQLRDASGTAFRLNDPPLIFNELWYQAGGDEKSGLLPGTYKLGAWVHMGQFADQSKDKNGLPLASPFSSHIAALYNGDYAVYAVADQMLWKKAGTKDQGFSLFGLAMGAPGDRNRESFYSEGGFNWKGAISSRPEDVLGLAFGYAKTSSALQAYGEDSIAFTGSGKHYPSNETVIELTYLYQAAPWWTLQPDLQYVMNPGAALPSAGSGIDNGLRDTLTVGVRSKIDF